METALQKKEIRKRMREIKKSFSPEQRLEFSLQVEHLLETLPEFAAAHSILLYYSLPDEVNTEYLLRRWSSRTGGSKRILLPVVDGDDLIIKEYVPSQISSGYQNIPEPTGNGVVDPREIDLAVVPGVAFDACCNRMGRGKGFYDRFLPKTSCRTIGIAFNFQLVDKVPCEPFDRPLDMLVSQDKVYRAR